MTSEELFPYTLLSPLLIAVDDELRAEELSPDPLPNNPFPLSLPSLPSLPDTSSNQCSKNTAVSTFTRTIIIKF